MTLPERDPRIYFAAERTFLAWIRTGLALMGFGFVVARFGLLMRELGAAATNIPLTTSGFSVWAGTAMVLVGVAVNALSAVQHIKVIRDLNEGKDVTGKPSATGVALAILLAVVGIAMAVYLVMIR